MPSRDHPLTLYAWKNLLAWHRHEFCRRWLTFANFLADMGEKPKGKCVRRRNPYQDYGKRNCYWGDPPGGSSTFGPKPNLINFRNQKKTVIEWAAAIGVSTATLYKRLKRMPMAEALQAKPGKSGVNIRFKKAK